MMFGEGDTNLKKIFCSEIFTGRKWDLMNKFIKIVSIICI